MKIKWNVEPPPTGKFRSFAFRGWPYATVGDRILARLHCDTPYHAQTVRNGEHGPLTVYIRSYSSGKAKDYKFKEKAKTLAEAKEMVVKYVEKNGLDFKPAHSPRRDTP